ncbi:uncharacterized protein FOMMEDRAFT_16640 [Fomitiporia mediterranea MF3/22]|uniref:uncharacterized protein n=1 Tax=Fomitiporia mediterranea (strain MF3/22) TaxID=694068 RepID=UPI0004408D56|nr:uncharacterized protein FOMMEDRAFT_16640 [Fomitiporia mediterranea MF3/22]EJD08172.1 hypothetical protein FOMMEDRAFT_16640 [Fomitiporia mediterranea MF3/22]
MNPKVCEHFAIFLPIAGGIVLTIVPNMLVALRVYALYQKNRVVQIFLAIYLVSELGIALWIYLTPGHHPLELPPLYQNHKVLYLCTEDTADSLGRWRPSTFQLMQVVYDVIVLILVFFKTKWPRESRHGIFDIIFNQGVIYFICVFSANLVWVLMILVGPETLKYIAACPTLVMACTMANRITLDLREYAQRPVINSSVSLDSHADANGQYTGQYTIHFKTPRTPPPPPPDLESQQSRAESDRSTIYNSEDEYDFQRPLEPTTLPFFDKPVGSGVRDG